MKILTAGLITGLAFAGAKDKTITPPPPQPAMTRQIQNAIDAGDGDVMMREYRKLVAAQPDNLEARVQLAKLYTEKGSPELALEHLRFAAARTPDSAPVQLGIAKSLRALNMRPEAIQGLQAFLAKNPQSTPEYQAWLGLLYDEDKQFSAGETAHRAALALRPNEAYLHNNLGYNLLLQGKSAEAVQEFQAALRIDPESTVARSNLGLAQASDPALAAKTLRTVTDPASAHNNLAAVMIERGDYTGARKELDLALGYNKQHPAALENLRLISQLDGKPATMPAGKYVPKSWWRSALHTFFMGTEAEQKRNSASAAASQ